VLVNQRVTRMPSVHFLFAHWKSLVDDPASVVNVGVSRRSVFYVVNPDNDLTRTQQAFESWFSRLVLLKSVWHQSSVYTLLDLQTCSSVLW